MGKTGQLLDAMVQIAFEILKTTSSVASALILKKMVSVFQSDLLMAPKFVVLIKEAILYYLQPNNGDDDDGDGGDDGGDDDDDDDNDQRLRVSECPDVVRPLFGCV